MAVIEQVITEKYALYNGDCIEVMARIPDRKIGFSVYSPPFGGLFHYSSSERDLSNAGGYAQFFEHYGFVLRELARVTMPGRLSAVHCADVPSSNSGRDHLIDFPGDIIRAHAEVGFKYIARHAIWKEPLAVRNRTMAKNLAHRTVIEDSAYAGVASADYLLIFRRDGQNAVAIDHPSGLLSYAGASQMPSDLQRYRGWSGNQRENKFSHWIWRRYASSFWDDIRIERVLPFRSARDEADERHVHPLQLDVIERCIVLRSNPGDTVLTPFMGVGSEVYVAVALGRCGIGVELKPSYFRQAVRNLAVVESDGLSDQGSLAAFDQPSEEADAIAGL